ncbi:MAG: type I pullulanase [Limnochordia bacterium]|jgi:pullulanase|nr:type I pullulanase [Bacillota bacterium]NLL08492.1 type I pullulanase [Bacillota bacterium]HBG08572.1 type I pullulanase [Bacillota bacterium]
MQRWKRAVGLVFLVLVVLCSPLAAFGADEEITTVRIHYHRPDGDYEPWNLWIWTPDQDGRAYEFDDEDAFGKVATIELPGRHERVGFIVRTDDWQKDVSADRFIEEFHRGAAEIWLVSKDPTIYTAPPAELGMAQTSHEEVTVKVHYRRHDQDYTGWNLWMWVDGREGFGIEFTEEDDFGKIAVVPFTDLQDATSLGIIVRRSTATNAWAQKDVEHDRFIPLFRADEQGQIEVWLMEKDARLYYRYEDIDLDPRFISAVIDEPRLITVRVNLPFAANPEELAGFELLADGKNVPIEAVVPTKLVQGFATEVQIVTQEDLVLQAGHVLSKEPYGEVLVGFGQIFSSRVFEEAFHYAGGDLGAVYTPEATKFRLWAPTASQVNLVIYPHSVAGLGTEYPMERDVQGTWVAELPGDLHGVYYTYRVTVGGRTNEAVDPYARAVGVNGERSMVIDLSRTNPEGWAELVKPSFHHPVDAIIYELHVRDLSMHPQSGITHKGKFLGLTERGTRGPGGVTTGLDHLLELGVTHVHLLPSFDYATVDETRLFEPQFNWGYDPQNYNVPEGSYSTNPFNGEVRVREFKEMVKTLNENGLRVVMDVVYNHTSKSADSHLNLIVPGYYYRFTPEGSFSNGSGCGNELADERSMVRKMIVDSVVYWATEYRVDGFRFDLMGLHHIDTMNAIRAALDEVDPSIIIYGEGWTAADSTLPEELRTLKAHVSQVPGIAVFSDDVRDGIKGHVFNDTEPGFVNGQPGMEESVKFGIAASTYHPQVNYALVNYSDAPYAADPGQTITYAEAHDNLTLWDKLLATNPGEPEEELLKMHKMASAIVLTSQGIPFIHAGQDFVRTKYGDGNSYQSPDSVNQLDWERKLRYLDVFEYNKGLIELRKAHPAFRMRLTEDIQDHLEFMAMPAPQMVGYVLKNHTNGDSWGQIVVLFNAGTTEQTVALPGSGWVVVVDGEQAGTEALWEVPGGKVSIPARTSLVLVDAASFKGGR